MPDQNTGSPKTKKINIKKLLQKTNERRASDGKKPLALDADGKTVKLSNGALATWKPAVSPKSGRRYARWLIVKGTNSEYLRSIRNSKGSKSASASKQRKSRTSSTGSESVASASKQRKSRTSSNGSESVASARKQRKSSASSKGSESAPARKQRKSSASNKGSESAPARKTRTSKKVAASESPAGNQRVSRKRVYKALSKSKAKKAFNEYYLNREYSSEAKRNAAMKRDLNSSPRNAAKYLVKDERYLLNPGRYDYPGVDAGPRISNNSGNLSALSSARNSPKSPRRSHEQVLREIRRSK